MQYVVTAIKMVQKHVTTEHEYREMDVQHNVKLNLHILVLELVLIPVQYVAMVTNMQLKHVMTEM